MHPSICFGWIKNVHTHSAYLNPLQTDTSVPPKISFKMLEPPQLAPFDMEEQPRYTEHLPKEHREVLRSVKEAHFWLSVIPFWPSFEFCLSPPQHAWKRKICFICWWGYVVRWWYHRQCVWHILLLLAAPLLLLWAKIVTINHYHSNNYSGVFSEIRLVCSYFLLWIHL